MKICISFLTFGKDIFGGIENAVYNLAIGLRMLAVDVIVYTNRSRMNGDITDDIRIFRSSKLQNQFTGNDEDIFNHYKRNQSAIESEFISLLKRESPDYILAIDHLWGIIPMINVWEHIKCPIGLVFHVAHNPILLDRVGSMPFNHLFSVSDYLTNELRKICSKLQEKSFHLLSNSVNLRNFFNRSAQRTDTIFCSARLSPEKGIELLVLAFIEIVKKVPQMKLQLCAGEFLFGNTYKTRQNVERIIEQNKELENRVEFLPLLQWNEIPRYLNSARVAVLPTQKESFGLSALEAMAAGISLVATNTGNLPNLVKDAAITIDYGSIDDIVEAVLKIVSDDNLALNLIKKGLAIAREYDNVVIAKKFLDDIRE